ncbi:RES domain-containing protein [Arthrobacter sp. ok909]|nr:RES domain-containing protein [Arthrobacter sp. ok909]
MCLAHITDSHLLRRVEEFAETGECTICETESLMPRGHVVNVERVARVVADVASRSYDHEGFVVDNEQLSRPLQTDEVVATLLDGSVEPAAFDLVSGLTKQLVHQEQDWFEPFDEGYEAGVQFEWDDFEQSLKHESRLLTPTTSTRPKTAPEKNYAFVRSLLVFAEERAGLVRTLRRGTKLYRARTERDSRALEEKVRDSPARELGPAPAERVTAGRMNAQGVPMLYVALDAETACAEVASHSPYDEAVGGAFILQQTLRILDLTQVPPPRSVFDETHEEGDDRLRSLNFYKDRITRPVILDDNHPVDYVPSQMLTEAFRWWTNPSLDGIAFPSRVRKGGTNVVLFFGDPMWFEQQGRQSSRFTRFQRDNERGNQGPVFIIDPKTVRRYRVKRALTVERQ